MITRADLSVGWTLRLAEDADTSAVPDHIVAALPIPAGVPDTVHTDLLAAGLIADPYIDVTELTLDWISRVEWVYETELDGHADDDERIVLAFDGLDTICTVTTASSCSRDEVVGSFPELGASGGSPSHRAGVLKAGIRYWSIPKFERRVLFAVASAHTATGAPVMAHLDHGSAAHEVLDILEAEGVPADAIVLAHIDLSPNVAHTSVMTAPGDTVMRRTP